MSIQTKIKSVKNPQIIIFNLKDYVFSQDQKELLKICAESRSILQSYCFTNCIFLNKYSALMAAGRLNFAILLSTLPLAFRHIAELFEN